MYHKIAYGTAMIVLLILGLGDANASDHTKIECWGYGENTKAVFSLNVKEAPLKAVVMEIAKSTDCGIILDKEYEDHLITLKFNKLPLLEGIKRVLRNGSLKNYMLYIDEAKNKINIMGYDAPTVRQIKSDKNRKIVQTVTTDKTSKKMPVTPPLKSGRSGLTMQELKAHSEANKMMPPPEDMPLLPPSGSGKPGLTMSELKASNEANKMTPLPENMPLSPPSNSGESGLAMSELKASNEANKKMPPPEDRRVLPPTLKRESDLPPTNK